jgi:hypothetical protein
VANDHRLRIYLSYQSLFVSDLRFTLNRLERAYNLLQASELNRKRVPRSQRLIIQEVATGRSIEAVILGGTGLLALWRIAERVFNARKTAWESEKAKWDAKLAHLEYTERMESVEARNRQLLPEEQAEELLAGLLDTLAQRGEVKAIALEVDRRTLRLGSSKGDEARNEDDGR